MYGVAWLIANLEKIGNDGHYKACVGRLKVMATSASRATRVIQPDMAHSMGVESAQGVTCAAPGNAFSAL
jgi:hypothetical protein